MFGIILKNILVLIVGEANPTVLTFDHQRDKKYQISDILTRYCLSTIKKEIDKCVVRCANCHLIKTSKDFGWYKNIKK